MLVLALVLSHSEIISPLLTISVRQITEWLDWTYQISLIVAFSSQNKQDIIIVKSASHTLQHYHLSGLTLFTIADSLGTKNVLIILRRERQALQFLVPGLNMFCASIFPTCINQTFLTHYKSTQVVN